MSTHDEIRAALAKATPGPWARWRDQDGQPHMHGLLMVGIADEVIPTGEALVNTREPDGPSPIAECYIEEDAHLIANAPAWLAELLAENEPIETCARCGKPAEGLATIDDRRYCHGEEIPSCYDLAQERVGAEAYARMLDCEDCHDASEEGQ